MWGRQAGWSMWGERHRVFVGEAKILVFFLFKALQPVHWDVLGPWTGAFCRDVGGSVPTAHGRWACARRPVGTRTAAGGRVATGRGPLKKRPKGSGTGGEAAQKNDENARAQSSDAVASAYGYPAPCCPKARWHGQNHHKIGLCRGGKN